MAGIFVSYRRNDVGLIAGDVVDELQKELDVPIFFDLQSIQAGADFRQTISDSLQGCDIVVVLLGKDWYGPADRGERRIDDPDDIFRNEIQTALQTDAQLIPVLVGIPALDDRALGPLEDLARRQWHQIRLGQKQADIKALVHAVQQRLYERRQSKLGGSSGQLVNIEPYKGWKSFSEPEPPERTLLATEAFYTQDLRLRVDAARVTGRPLLVIGSAGSGRSGVARHVAELLGWRLYEHVVTSRFTVQDLLYHFDATRRLSDAQHMARTLSNANYLEPGVIWWSFDRNSASTRGAPPQEVADLVQSIDPALGERDSPNTVLHIASLDNAKSSDVEDLLIVLETGRFSVVESGILVEAHKPPLTILTAANPRILQQELARVIIYQMPFPTFDEFVRIARLRFPHVEPGFIKQVADILQGEVSKRNLRKLPEVRDFVDLVRVLAELEIKPEGTNWRVLLDALGLL